MELQSTTQTVTFQLDEGNFGTVDDYVSQLGMVKAGKFVKQLHKDDFVELSANKSDCVTKAAAGNKAIGSVESDPKLVDEMKIEATNFDDLANLRIASINLFVPGTAYSLKLSDSNTAIASGDYLKIGTDGKLTKAASTNTGCKATEAKAANAGGYIDVIITDAEGITVSS